LLFFGIVNGLALILLVYDLVILIDNSTCLSDGVGVENRLIRVRIELCRREERRVVEVDL
jgi:hypothetical protein